MDATIIDFFTTYILTRREPSSYPPPVLTASEVSALEPGGKLFGLFQRVYALHYHSRRNTSPTATTITQAVQVWHDLDIWDPDGDQEGGIPPEPQILLQLYKHAIFLWTYLIVHPDDIYGRKAQNTMRDILSGIEEVREVPELGIFLVIPLFFGGRAAVLAEHREAVQRGFEHLMEVFGEDEIKDPYDSVQRSWRLYDSGMQSSWDWMRDDE
ncbi:hypothetical protein BJY01DRAFT_198257 [Aspergillus pseudoustus]|uniref:Fungal-specific transcription factor domain-containing protein n=1 Tax=Aspergillus pseudoustus TaxID=1810923 RepID=A0ABR4JSY7_9EURO